MKRSYLPPLSHDIRKRLLSDTKNKIKSLNCGEDKVFIQTYGTKLAGNGWSLVNNHLLVNIMCLSLAGAEFLGAIDTLGHMKDAVYITGVMKRYLMEVGPKNVVQICMDNASMMRKATSIL
jgi:hypothetical protein